MLNLVTFADSRMSPTLKRLKKQASYFDDIRNVFAYTEKDLSAKFIEETNGRLNRRNRGFGYWAWKPEVVLMAFDQMKFGEVVCYCDAGFHLNLKASVPLSRYTDPIHSGKADIVAFCHTPEHLQLSYDSINFPNFSESRYTKGDMLEFWQVKSLANVVDSPQYASGLFFLKKTTLTVELITRWRDAAIKYPLLFDDSPSISPNLAEFIEHRHDQSYFSLMCKANHHIPFSAFEFWFPRGVNFEPDWNIIMDYPFHAKRDKAFAGLRRYWQPLFRWYLLTVRKIKNVDAN